MTRELFNRGYRQWSDSDAVVAEQRVPPQRHVADCRVREIEARQVREDLQRRGGRIVEAFHIPETEAPQIVERGERFHEKTSDEMI